MDGVCFWVKVQLTIIVFLFTMKKDLHKEVSHLLKLVFNSELNIVNTNYSNRCCLISGPNGAGKTIYMKQLGTMIYLAHCGFHVPASFAEIPLMDRIIVTQSGGSLYSN